MKRAFDKSELTALGRRVEAPKDVDASVLEFVHIPPIAKVTFDCNEFTSLCPVTGQPDYATLKISLLYNDPRLLENKPPTLTIETKSLKLFLEGFRNKGMFQEDICHRIAEVIRQRYYDAACVLAECALHPSLVTVRVEMFFNSRGGIAINPVCEL